MSNGTNNMKKPPTIKPIRIIFFAMIGIAVVSKVKLSFVKGVIFETKPNLL